MTASAAVRRRPQALGRGGKRVEFGEVFRPDGIWARFLGEAQGYIATEISCESVGDGRYRVRDFWSWHREFEIFRERFSEEFAEFDRAIVDELVEKNRNSLARTANQTTILGLS